jgi:hypothetical protein
MTRNITQPLGNTAPFTPTRSVRRASGLVLVGNSYIKRLMEE